MARIAGRSVVWAEGPEHTRQRQALLPVFTSEAVRGMEEDIKRCSDRMIAKLRDHLLESRPPKVDVLPWTSKATLDVIGAVGFGYDFRCGEDEAAMTISQTWAAQSALMVQFPAFVGMKVLQLMPWLNKLPFEALKAQERMRDMIKDLGRSVYTEREKSKEGVEGRDLLSRLMRMREAHGMDLEELLEQVRSITVWPDIRLTWAMYRCVPSSSLVGRQAGEFRFTRIASRHSSSNAPP